MAVCEVCGNDYWMSFEVRTAGAVHTFDSFECAIHRLAPICEHCRCRIIGHGVEADGRFFCCAHCASAEGEHGWPTRSECIPASRLPASTDGSRTRPRLDSRVSERPRRKEQPAWTSVPASGSARSPSSSA